MTSHDELLRAIGDLAEDAMDLHCEAAELAGHEPGIGFDDDRDGHGAGVALAWELHRIAERLHELSELAWLHGAARKAAEREDTP